MQTAQAIQVGEASCEEVIQAHVDRMHAANPAINAVTMDLSEEALEQARTADQMKSQGNRNGALFGVPITIKENVDVKGQATTNGLPAYANLIVPDDSPVVRNLKKAGEPIIIGRTNTPEFSFRAFTDNPLRGLTKNPWDDRITSGGSSGGEELLWRPNLVMIIAVGLIGSLLLKQVKYKQWIGLFTIFIFPFIAGILFYGDYFGLEVVETNDWGGLVITLVLS